MFDRPNTNIKLEIEKSKDIGQRGVLSTAHKVEDRHSHVLQLFSDIVGSLLLSVSDRRLDLLILT